MFCRPLFVVALGICVLALFPSPVRAQEDVCAYEPAASASETLAHLLARSPRFNSSVPHTGKFQVWWCRHVTAKTQRGYFFTVSEDGDVVDFYSQTGRTTHVEHSGTAVPMAQRSIKGPGSAFVLKQPGTVYARVSSYWPAQFDVLSPAAFAAGNAYNITRYGLILFYVGLLCAIGVYHLAQYALVRNRDSLFYAIYLAALIVDEFSFGSGFGWLFVWPHASVSLELAQDWISPLIMVANYAFVREFFSTRKLSAFIDRLLLTIMIAYPALEALTYWLSIEDIASSRAYVSYFVFPALQALAIAVAMYAGRRGNRSAWFVVVAFSTFFIGTTFSSIAQILGNAFHVDPSQSSFVRFGIAYFWEIGSALEALLLSLALADRVRTAHREREAAQQNLIAGLQEYNDAVDRFVPRAFLDHLGRPSVVDVQLGDHVERDMAVLFSDIRGFTSLSEQLTPAAVFELLNGYLAQAAPAIAACNGFIDKFIGDAIMALFPGGANDALHAAVALQRAAQSMHVARPFRIGVGIHIGPLMLGTIGERARLETTVIADAVNVASRVEGLTKELHARILITDDTKLALGPAPQWDLRYLGQIAVKGKAHTIGIHEVLAVEDAATLALRTASLATFARAVAALEDRQLTEAAACFDAVLALDPDDGAAQALRTRALTTAQNSPA